MARRRTPTLQVTDDNLISSGLQLDRHTLKRAMWESASGVIFANGQIRRKRPTSLAFDVGNGSPIRGLSQQYASDGGRWLWAAANRRVSRWQFGAPEMIVDTAWVYHPDATATARPTFYDFTPYGDWEIVNSGEPGQHAYIYKPVDGGWQVFAVGQAPTGAVKFLKFMSFVVAVGHGQRGTQVSNSDANNIELWVSAGDNTASSLAIDEFNTPIRAADRIGDAISVYSEDQLALVRYIGAPFILGQKTVIDGIGAIGKAAVAGDMNTNVGVSRAGCWWTDGITSRYIDEGYLANYLQDNVNWDQGAKIAVARNDYDGTFEFSFPVRGSLEPNEAWAWDPKTGGWSPIVKFFTAMDERRLFNFPVKGFGSGEVHLSDFENPLTQEPLSLVTKPLVMSTSESPHVVCRIDELDILLHKAKYVEFQVGSCDEPDGDYSWTTWTEVDAGAVVQELEEIPEAAYFKLALRNVPDRQADWDMDFQGFLMYGATVGSKM
jgi:hypothetical protein